MSPRLLHAYAGKALCYGVMGFPYISVASHVLSVSGKGQFRIHVEDHSRTFKGLVSVTS